MEFNEALFKTKIDNIFVKLLSGVMKGTLEDVAQFLNDDVRSRFQQVIDELNGKDERHMFDELNVKDTRILSRENSENAEIIKVEIISRYMDYYLKKSTGEFLRGDNTRRIEKTYNLTFEKKNDTRKIGIVRKCPNCGASMDVNATGRCPYCNNIFKQDDYDYILTDIS